MPSKKKKFDFQNLTNKGNVHIPPYHLQNVVSTFSLGTKGLNLRLIAMKYAFLEFNPQTFAAAIIRIRDPRTTALAFQSGNMVCTGARSLLQSRLAARKYCSLFQKVGIPVSFNNFKIQNIVASATIGFTIKLQDIADAYGPYTQYEPDLFPGLILRSINPKLVFLIFRSGKIVITGGKKVEDVERTYHTLYTNIIIKYKDIEGSTSSSSVYRSEIRQKKLRNV
jgi:transcription initiation factor TFIID TATA-box-binding protein